jgi:2,3-bisphosphoglycerate-dependent phosphoglycerate mutase
MRLYLIRHGQSLNNAAYSDTEGGYAFGSPGRVADPELTPLGHRQAAALARAVRDGRAPLPLTHLYSSRILRAVRTAAHLADALDLTVVLRDDAHEVGGIHHQDPSARTRRPATGLSIDQLQLVSPRVVAPAGSNPADAWHGGFETVDDALPRAHRLLADLATVHGGTGDHVGLVTHQHFSQFILAAVLGLTGPPSPSFRLDNTAHVSLDLTPADPQIHWVNRCDHLAAADVTT